MSGIVKRRGLIAGAAAMVAGLVATRTAQQVGATLGGANGQFLVIGANSFTGNTPNTGADETDLNGTLNGVATFYGFNGGLPVTVGATTFNPSALRGQADSGWAVYGHSTGNTGVIGSSSGNGNGTVGRSFGTGAGVFGLSFGSGYAVEALPGTNHGVYAEAGSGQGAGALVGVSNFVGGVGFQARANAPATYAGFFVGTVSITGSLGVSGSKFAIVKSSDGEYHGMYAVESPECWFEDVGTGTVSAGKADIKLDPTFAQHVHADDYHVFITEIGGNNALHVASKAATGFSVEPDAVAIKAMGKSAAGVNSTFSYRVMAKRNDIAGERFPVWKMPPESNLPGPTHPANYAAAFDGRPHGTGITAPAAQPRPAATGGTQSPVQPAPAGRP